MNLASLLGLFALLLLATSASAQPQQVNPPGLGRDEAQRIAAAAGLFNDAGVEPAAFEAPVVRQRVVRIKPEVGMLRKTKANERVRLNLFEDADFTGIVHEVIERPDGTHTLLGQIEGDLLSSFALSVNGDVMVGNVRKAGRGLFQLRPVGNGVHVTQFLNEELFPPCGTGLEHNVAAAPDFAGPSAPAPTTQAQADTGTVIDLMVVYTPAARTAAGGTAAIEALINLGVDESNAAYQQSQITPRLRLVHKAELSYTESGNFNTELTRLTSTSDGFIDVVHSLRQTYGADAVSLIINNSSACGIGWVMTSLSASFAGNAFNVVHYGCATGYYSLAHELGHNMGCMHDRENSSNNGLYAYSYGWRFTGGSGTQYRTIMSYAPGARIPRFSNPNVLYDGVPTGVPVGQANQAHNALTINNSAYTFANFRQATFLTAPTGLTPGSANPDGSVVISAAPVTLRWNSALGADRYRVSIYQHVSGAWSFLNTYETTSTSFAFTPPASNTSYSFSVEAATSTLSSPASAYAYFNFQTTACSYSISPTSASTSSAGGPGTVTVTAATGCGWNASSSVPWISITSGTTGSGNGTVSYSVAANTSTSARDGSLTVATQTFSVSQAGAPAPCNFTLSPTSQSFSSSGGNSSVSLTTSSGCSWSAASNAGWITITAGASGTGSGTVNYSVAPNSLTTSRSGTMTIAGQTFTITQAAAAPTQLCTYNISPASASVSSGGGTFSFSVTSGTGCAWSASTSTSWITILQGSSGAGNGTVSYRVATNRSKNARTGTIIVAGKTFTLSQSGK